MRISRLLPALMLGAGLLLPSATPALSKTTYKVKKYKVKKFKVKKYKARKIKHHKARH